MNLMKSLIPAVALVALPQMGLAQEAAAGETAQHTQYILTSLLFLVGGFLVFWMAAGFAMLEAGLVRSKNVAMQLVKNMGLFSFAAIMYWLVGFNLMYPGDGWTITGVLGAFSPTSLEPIGLADTETALDYASVGSDFFFQLMFCATTASIVSGTMAERVKLWPFFFFVIVLTGIIYPIEGVVAVGWWLAVRDGLQRFRRFNLGPCCRWFRSTGRCHRAGSTDRQVQQGRQSCPDPRLESGAGDLGYIHPVAGLGWLQRRLAAGHGHHR